MWFRTMISTRSYRRPRLWKRWAIASLALAMLSATAPNPLWARTLRPMDDDDVIFRSVSSNVANFVAFIKEDGIYVSGQRRVRKRVGIGDEAPGTGGGVFQKFTAMALNSFIETLPIPTGEDDSTLVFVAELDGGKHSQGIFTLTQNRLSPIALTGGIAPDTGGGTFIGFGDKLAISDRIISLGPPRWEVILFRGFVGGGKAKEGLFAFGGNLGQETQIVTISLEGRPASGTGGGKISSFGDFALNASGLVAYVVNIEGGGVDQGIYFALPFLLGIVNISINLELPAVLAGQAAAGAPGAKYQSFDNVVLVLDTSSLNLVHELAFRATLTGGTETSPKSGVFQIAYVLGIPVSNALALQGQLAPQSSGAKYASFSQIVGNNQQQLTFYAEVNVGLFPAGIFQVTLGPFTLASKTLELGALAPDTGGGRFDSFRNLSLSDNGRTVFNAKISKGNVPEGVFFSFAKQVTRVRTEP